MRAIIFRLILIWGFILTHSTSIIAKETDPGKDFHHPNDTSEYQKFVRAYLHYKDLNNDSALYFVKKGISLAIKENNKFQEASLSLNAGILYDRMGDNANCAENFEKAYQIFLEIEDYENAVSALNNYGTMHISINQNDEAARILFDALKLAEEKNLINQKGMIYSNLGLLFYYQEEWDKSIDYYYKAIPFYSQSENYKSLALIYNNVGISYYFKDILDSVLYNFEKSLEMYVELDDKFGQTRPLFNIGEIYFTNGDYEKAFEYYNKSLALEKEIGYIKGAAISLVNIGALYTETEQYDKAFEYLFESLPLIDSVEDNYTLIDAYRAISVTYQHVGDDAKALEYLKLYSDTKDTIFDIEKTKQVSELEAIYQTEKKEQLIQFQQKELKGKTLRNIILIICLVLALGLAIHVIITNKRKRRTNDLLRKKNSELAEKNRKITSSITYASLIQAAILPPQDMFSEYFPEHFIFFEPKDIVSGDFYWITKKDDSIIVAVADCTGHGVPGAFMSMLGMTFLNEIVNIYGLTKPDEVLNMLRKKIISALHLEEKTHDTRDGMDIALCNINLTEKKLEFSGAYRPLIIIRDGKQIKLNPDRMPIGYHKFKNGPFKSEVQKLLKGDTIYLFTDGYADQFGGENNKKLTIRRFHESIMNFSTQPIDNQKQQFSNAFKTWKGNNEQIDDVTVMGIKI